MFISDSTVSAGIAAAHGSKATSAGARATARVLDDAGTRFYDVIADDSDDELPPISCLEGEEDAPHEPEEQDGDVQMPGGAEVETPHAPSAPTSTMSTPPPPATPLTPTPPPSASPTLLELATAAAAAERCELKICKREGSEDSTESDDEEERAPKKARVDESEADFGVLQACNGQPKNGSKVFACKECSRSFGRGSDVERHVRSVHLRLPWKCLATECASRELFSRKDSLFRHISVSHREDSERLKALYRKRGDGRDLPAAPAAAAAT